MTAEAPTPDADLPAQLSGIAARLIDIAGCVASEAEAATAIVRGMADHASRLASLAAALEAAANVMEAGVRHQADTLATARAALTANKPTIDALAGSVEGVASISKTISRIAQESRVLSLNARIEAARAGVDGGPFAVVAAEMSTLANRTKAATDRIGEQALMIADDTGAATKIVAAHGRLVVEQDELLATSLHNASQQRDAATQMAAITVETAGTVDRAASAIGRVGANAVAVKVLARQISRLAGSRP